mmetsp:Transcript_24472/g.52917  ORF Transcript_24472/g.52917 Transcript_24472/m.52917 type:complete len:108 (-) Transcript_24472:554-877(-)
MHGGTSYGHVSQDPHGGGGAAWQQRQAHKNKNNGADNNQFDVRHSNPSGDLSPREPEGGDDVLNTTNTAKNNENGMGSNAMRQNEEEKPTSSSGANELRKKLMEHRR